MAEREEIIAGVREILDVLEANPSLPLPCGLNELVIFHVRGLGVTEREGIQHFHEIVGGPLYKEDRGSDDLIWVSRRYRGASLAVCAWKVNTCTRRVVGIKKFKVLEAPPGVQLIEREVEEEIVEWDCGPLLSPEEVQNGSD